MKTLIVYETKHGTVEHAVALLAGKLHGETRTARVSDTLPKLSKFDTVIIGGSIYFGEIQKTLAMFMVKNREELLGKRLGLFICGAHPDPAEREKELENAFPKEFRDRAEAQAIFGYQIHFQELNPLERSIAKSILRQKVDKVGLNEEAIEAFAAKFN
ncbi:flavodoxin domain-containing protein [Neobacillus piezotolerans]|nr:flavodoxin domain-containing protein [Neobacillus piezotolerans]